MATTQGKAERAAVSVDVRRLVSEYLRAAEDVASRMRRRYGVDDLLAAYHAGKVPRTGPIEMEQGSYRFHGVGCYFELGDTRIDIDFGPGGSTDAFDAWRLVRFARETLKIDDLDIHHVRRELDRLAADGTIAQRLEWSGELFFRAAT